MFLSGKNADILGFETNLCTDFYLLFALVSHGYALSRAVHQGARDHFAARRRRVVPFVEKYYSLKGALRINRKAFAKDMLRTGQFTVGHALSGDSGVLVMCCATLGLTEVSPGFRTRVHRTCMGLR